MNSCKLSVPDKLQVLPPWVVAKHQQNRFTDDHVGGGGGGGDDYDDEEDNDGDGYGEDNA